MRRNPAIPMFVYFAVAGGMVKIGCSIDPIKRIENRQEWSPYPIQVVATIEAGFRMERAIQAKFAPEWSHNEWFRISDRLQQFIQSVTRGDLSVLPDSRCEVIPVIPQKAMATRAKWNLTAMVNRAEDRFYGAPGSWLDRQKRESVRPQAVKDALESYKGAHVGFPSWEAESVLIEYARALNERERAA